MTKVPPQLLADIRERFRKAAELFAQEEQERREWDAFREGQQWTIGQFPPENGQDHDW